MRARSVILAAVVAGGTLWATAGSAGAQTDQNQVRCDDCFAFVAADATLERHKGAASATQLGTGQFEVLFDHRISGCAWQATLALETFSGSVAPGMINATGRAGTVNGLFIQTFDTNGTPTNRPFNVLISC